jgi:hypothetical protein
MESHKAGFPSCPHSLGIPSGLPHSHGLDDEIRYLEATAKTRRSKPRHRKGLVTNVPGPKCNGCSGTLTSQEGLVSLFRAERMRLHFVVAVAMGAGVAGRELGCYETPCLGGAHRLGFLPVVGYAGQRG